MSEIRDIQTSPSVLVIDDLRDFSDESDPTVFDNPKRFTYARTTDEGMAHIDAMFNGDEQYDALYLDHDLGMEGDIRPIVMRIVEEAVVNERFLPVEYVRLVSANPVGCDWMRSQLKPYYGVYG